MKNTKIVIVGAGGLGRIVHDVLSRDEDITAKYIISGFLDTRDSSEISKDIQCKLLGSPLTYQVKSDEVYIPAIGDPKLRRALLQPLIEQQAEFYSYQNNSSIAPNSKIGRGVFVTPGSVISTGCAVDDFCYIDTYTIVGHDVKIGAYCMLGAMGFVAGNVEIDCCVAIHPRATIGKGVHLGEECVIGLGSVVLKNVPSRVTVFGNPARVIYG